MSVLVLGWLAGPAAAQDFPEDPFWVPLSCRDHLMTDPYRDESGATDERDLVGDLAEPVGYRAVDLDFAYFRIRLDQDPMPDGNLRPFAWGVLLDRDGDLTTYDVMLLVNGITNEVELYRNTVTTTFDTPTDPPDEPPVAVWPLGSTVRSVPATGSSQGGDPDTFLELAVPFDELLALDIGPFTPIVVWLATSSTASSLNGDFACHDAATEGDPSLSGAGTEVVILDPDGDSDGDGFSDSVELGEGSDPKDPNSIPEGETPDAPILEGGGGCSTAGGGTAIGLLAAFLAMRRRRSDLG